jgi:magnesium transporter
MSVRGLYQYVLSAITGDEDHVDDKAGSKGDGHTSSSPQQDVTVTTTTSAADREATQEGQSHPAYDHSRKSKRAKRSKTAGRGGAAGGTDKKKEGRHVTYRDRLGSYLSPRDMRRLAIPVSKRNEPEIIVRRHAICVNVDPLPAIILRDRMLVIVPLGGSIGAGGVVGAAVAASPEDLVARVREALAPDGSDWSDSGAEDAEETTATASERTAGMSRHLKQPVSNVATNDRPSDSRAEGERSGSDRLGSDDGEGDDENDDESSEWKDIQGRDWLNVPFELQCLDSILSCTLEKVAEETREVQAAACEYVHKLVAPKGRNRRQYQDPHLIICAVKDAVSDVSSRVKAIVTALTRTLDDYEDMSLMSLSRLVTHPELFIQPVPIAVLEQESDQPELILEAHLQTGLALASALDLVKGQIESASVLIEQSLDAVRNRLLLANMILTVVAVCIGVASLVGSFMGMNLWNGIETSTDAFMIVVIVTLVATAVLFFAILLFLCYSGTIPVPGLGGG